LQKPKKAKLGAMVNRGFFWFWFCANKFLACEGFPIEGNGGKNPGKSSFGKDQQDSNLQGDQNSECDSGAFEMIQIQIHENDSFAMTLS
jgi:hypothetical protein